MPVWQAGQQCRVVEHDDATREPKPDGQVIPATVHRMTDGGLYVQVRTEDHGLLSFYASSGWHAWDGRFRWRLMPAQEETFAAMTIPDEVMISVPPGQPNGLDDWKW